MRVVIVRHSSIGDVVHTLPVLGALKRQGFHTSWIVEPPARVLLEGNPDLDEVVPAPPARAFSLGQAWAALRQLRRGRSDVALDFGGLWKSAAWARLSGARRVVGFDRRWRREPASAWLLSERAERPEETPHVIDKNLALLRPLGIEAVGSRQFPLPPSDAEAPAVEGGLEAAGGRPFAILNPGGGWVSKLWPASGFGEVARRLGERGLACLVTWGPGEEPRADEVVRRSQGTARRVPPTTLLDFLELARRASLVLAADTGPLHLACAVGTPVVGLYGPTEPLRNGPFSPQDQVVRKVPPCAPCYRRACPVHMGFMDGISPDEVMAAIDRRLAESPGRRDAAL